MAQWYNIDNSGKTPNLQQRKQHKLKKTNCLENKAWKLIHNVRKKNLFLLNTASNVDYRWNKYLKGKTIYVIEKDRDRRAEKEFLKPQNLAL